MLKIAGGMGDRAAEEVGRKVCNRSRPCAWGLTRGLPRAGRRAL